MNTEFSAASPLRPGPRPCFNQSMNYWLIKSEPAAYSWDQFIKDRQTAWTGVRNYQARLNLRAMKPGDLVLFYHSITDKQIVGLARVLREAYADPTATDGGWSCVDLAPLKPLAKPVPLETIKTVKGLQEMKLLKQSRMSVTPVTAPEFALLMKLAETKT